MKAKELRFVVILVVLMALAAPVSARTATGTGATPAGAVPSEGGSILVDWYEDWDSYPTGQNMHGVGGWKGWGNDPTWTAYTTDVQQTSFPNSIDISANADLVHEYAIDAGVWTYTAWQYVPANFSGTSYFLLLNQYDDAGLTWNWSTQIQFDSATETVYNDGPVGGTLPLIRDRWVELRNEIDLDNDWQQFYYDGVMLFEGSWSEGMSGGGITSIGCVDLFANGATPIYYDDLSLVEPGGENTMHVHDIRGFIWMGEKLVMLVKVADQDHVPLADVLVDASIATPMFDWTRWRYTHYPNGSARFWAPLGDPGTYEICVENLTLDGYVYDPTQNVYTCMDWVWP